MTHQLNRWDREHRNFARLLDVFGTQLALLRGEDEPDYELLLDIMDYLTSYTDRVHHPREDIIFSAVAQREPAVRPAADELARQHQQMAEDGKVLHALLQSILNGRIASRLSLERAGLAYVAAFRRHMDKEYQEVFPAAHKVLSQEDWDRIDAESGQIEADPLAGERLDQQYASLRSKIASAQGQ